MDFGFTEEQERLRQEVHEFFINELPQDYLGDLFPVEEELQSFHTELQKKTSEKGWLAPQWPKEYGGLGLDETERGIVNEEVGYWAIRWPNTIGINMAGPSLFLFGTEEQKRRFLPTIGRGEGVWYELFTEPDAGSDEANVQLRAVPDGDEFVLNGQKMFVGEAWEADYLYTLARTADTVPKHRGLTLFLINANTPGITYHSLPCLSGQIKLEIFFDDVRVQKDHMLGKLNQGFYHAMTTLEFERSNTGMAAKAKRHLEEFVQFCKETKRNGKSLIEDPQVRDTLSRIATEIEVWRLAGWRTLWRFGQREKLGALDYDLTGFFWRLFGNPHYEAMMNIIGPYALLRPGSKWALLHGALERRWRQTVCIHGGGTIGIAKIILAGRGLGLPRIPAKLNKEIMEALREKP